MARAMRRELPDHGVKLFLLFGCQFCPDALMDLFHFLVPDFPVSLLAFSDDFGNGRVLFRRQLECLVQASDKFPPPCVRRAECG